jgi:predicted nucleic acid-binding protein
MQDLVISDTSCLILLSKIGELDLLRATYGTVLIPSEVQSEYQSQDIAPLPGWIVVLRPSSDSVAQFQFPALDPGERAAFALASEHPGSLLIVDDKRARTIAKRLGFRTTGTIGVLLAAKAAGNIPAIKPLLDRILETDFYISLDIIQQVLRDANEQSQSS